MALWVDCGSAPAVGVPAKPTGIAHDSSTENSLTLRWSYLATASQPVEKFHILVRSDTSGEVRQFMHPLGSVHFDHVSTSFEVADLVPGMRYLVEISVVNEAGEGDRSDQHAFWTVAAREWLEGFM